VGVRGGCERRSVCCGGDGDACVVEGLAGVGGEGGDGGGEFFGEDCDDGAEFGWGEFFDGVEDFAGAVVDLVFGELVGGVVGLLVGHCGFSLLFDRRLVGV